jgi:hypothetical protein
MMNLGIYAKMGTHHYGFGETGSSAIGGWFLSNGGGVSTASGDRTMQEKGKKGDASTALGKMASRVKRSIHPDFGPVNEKDKYDRVEMGTRFQQTKLGVMRFFCNEDHVNMFREKGGPLAGFLAEIESGVDLSGDLNKLKQLRSLVRGLRQKTAADGPEAAAHVETYLTIQGIVQALTNLGMPL